MVGQVAHPFSLFLPAAKAESFQAGNSQVLIQTLRSELFAITVYEAVSVAEQRLEIVFEKPLLSLLFSITGSIILQRTPSSLRLIRIRHTGQPETGMAC
jgi:hypothetical protein